MKKNDFEHLEQVFQSHSKTVAVERLKTLASGQSDMFAGLLHTLNENWTNQAAAALSFAWAAFFVYSAFFIINSMLIPLTLLFMMKLWHVRFFGFFLIFSVLNMMMFRMKLRYLTSSPLTFVKVLQELSRINKEAASSSSD